MSIEELYRKLDFLSKDGFVTLDDANWPNKVQLSPRIFSLIQDVSSPLHEMSALFAIDLPATMSQINSHLEQTEYLVTTNSTMSTRGDLESRHGTPYDFVLYHLWLDFSGLVI